MNLPATATPDFAQLLTRYRQVATEFPHLRAVSAAQWALECGWGKSSLAAKFRNYGGAKWRTYMAPYAKPVNYAAHDGTTLYCNFASHDAWIAGYWARFDLEPSYKGWRNHTASGTAFLNFIGPIWLGLGETLGDEYVRKVTRIHDAYFADVFKEHSNEIVVDWEGLRRMFPPVPGRV